MSLEEYGDAIRLIEKALDQYPVMGNRGRKAELLWLLFQALDQTENKDAAATALDNRRKLPEQSRHSCGALRL